MQQSCGLPPHPSCRDGGILDSGRFKGFLAKALNVSVHDIQTLVLGVMGIQWLPYLVIQPFQVFLCRNG